jgi:hypothetical protein
VSGSNGFPIAGSVKKFEETCVGKLKNVSTKAHRFIRRLHPYKGGSSALWLLSELDNMDKHNAIVPVAIGGAQVEVQWGIPMLWVSPEGFICIGGGPEGSTMMGMNRGFGTPENAPVVQVLHDNVEIYRSKVRQMGFVENIEAFAEISFGKTQVTNAEPIIETLEGLIKLVSRIIDIVERRVL